MKKKKKRNRNKYNKNNERTEERKRPETVFGIVTVSRKRERI